MDCYFYTLSTKCKEESPKYVFRGFILGPNRWLLAESYRVPKIQNASFVMSYRPTALFAFQHILVIKISQTCNVFCQWKQGSNLFASFAVVSYLKSQFWQMGRGRLCEQVGAPFYVPSSPPSIHNLTLTSTNILIMNWFLPTSPQALWTLFTRQTPSDPQLTTRRSPTFYLHLS